MPRVGQSHIAHSPAKSPASKLLVLKYGTKRLLVVRPTSYPLALKTVARHFPNLRGDIVLQTDELDICAGELVEITSEAWSEVSPGLTTLQISTSAPAELAAAAPFAQVTKQKDAAAPAHSGRITLLFWHSSGKGSFLMKPDSPLERALPWTAQRLGKCTDDIYFTFDGIRVSWQTPADLNMQDGDTLDVLDHQVGGKPVIYLHSPVELDATVSLSLVPAWSFSAIYPVVPTAKATIGERVDWSVRTKTDGTLFEKTTGLEVAYLFWEAHTSAGRPPSPPPSPIGPPAPSGETFDPLTSDVSPATSVLLHTAAITPYLDSALRALGLHTEARTSFITYWLPAFLAHTHVALRFVDQAAYARAAPLDVRPAPDVVTRVFMLFRGIEKGAAEGDGWAPARARALQGVEWWKQVVGVDEVKVADEKLFRVLEWGGMEVLTK